MRLWGQSVSLVGLYLSLDSCDRAESRSQGEGSGLKVWQRRGSFLLGHSLGMLTRAVRGWQRKCQGSVSVCSVYMVACMLDVCAHVCGGQMSTHVSSLRSHSFLSHSRG